MSTFTCSSCGRLNRVSEARLEDGPRCGHCQTALDTSGRGGGRPLLATTATAEAGRGGLLVPERQCCRSGGFDLGRGGLTPGHRRLT